MENQALQEQMFRTMFRLRRFIRGIFLKIYLWGNLRSSRFCPGAGNVKTRKKHLCFENGIDDGSILTGSQPYAEVDGGQRLYWPPCGFKGPEKYLRIHYRAGDEKTGRMSEGSRGLYGPGHQPDGTGEREADAESVSPGCLILWRMN